MARHGSTGERLASLHRHHAVHPRPESVSDEAFVAGHEFFDPHDLVQVKYEMLRRHHEGASVTEVAARFGFSRPTFYQTQAAFLRGGLPALLPKRPGPRRAHKLTDEVMAFVEAVLGDDPTLRAPALAALIAARFQLEVHPRSIEHRLAQREKKRPEQGQ